MKTARSLHAFTLIELMCASTLLSVIVLLMVGMQDQMSKAWKNSNRRMDATREARAALRMMTRDLDNLFFRTNTSGSTFAYNPNRSPLPMVIVTNAGSKVAITNAQPGCVAIFALVQRQPTTPQPNCSFDEFAAVGYYIGSGLTTNINGDVRTVYNLYRYFRAGTNLTPDLISYVSGLDPTAVDKLFKPTASDEILARNTCNLQLTFYPSNSVPADGLIFSVPEGTGNSSMYRGNKYQVELTTYPDDVVVSGVLGSDLGKWADGANVLKYGRTFESRKNLERDK